MFRQISVLTFLRYISPYIPYVPGKSSIRRKKNHHFITVLFTGNQISLCTAQLFESNEWKIRRIPKRNEPILVGRLESSSRHACIFQRIRTGETSTRTSRRKTGSSIERDECPVLIRSREIGRQLSKRDPAGVSRADDLPSGELLLRLSDTIVLR